MQEACYYPSLLKFQVLQLNVVVIVIDINQKLKDFNGEKT